MGRTVAGVQSIGFVLARAEQPSVFESHNLVLVLVIEGFPSGNSVLVPACIAIGFVQIHPGRHHWFSLIHSEEKYFEGLRSAGPS